MKSKMRMQKMIATTVVIAAIAISPALAQQGKDASDKTKMEGEMSMQGMMNSCHEHQSANMKMMDDMMAMMGKAEKSNDKGEMRKSLKEMQQQMSSIRQHTMTCMENMNAMPGMKGHMMEHGDKKHGGDMKDKGMMKGGDKNKEHSH